MYRRMLEGHAYPEIAAEVARSLNAIYRVFGARRERPVVRRRSGLRLWLEECDERQTSCALVDMHAEQSCEVQVRAPLRQAPARMKSLIVAEASTHPLVLAIASRGLPPTLHHARGPSVALKD